MDEEDWETSEGNVRRGHNRSVKIQLVTDDDDDDDDDDEI